jgi:DNA-directed RNA polymerase subunit H (RpoH/RPB5)
MQIFPALLGLYLAITLPYLSVTKPAHALGQQVRQLSAVRGEIVKVKSPNKGMLLITVRPAKDFAEVTVLARENDLVGSAVTRAGDTDLLGLLSEDSRDDETITAAELNEGDVVSIIYDAQTQNRVMEIYLH